MAASLYDTLMMVFIILVLHRAAVGESFSRRGNIDYGIDDYFREFRRRFTGRNKHEVAKKAKNVAAYRILIFRYMQNAPPLRHAIRLIEAQSSPFTGSLLLSLTYRREYRRIAEDNIFSNTHAARRCLASATFSSLRHHVTAIARPGNFATRLSPCLLLRADIASLRLWLTHTARH